MNPTTSNRKAEHAIPHRYAVADSQFVGRNLPAMLAAIRPARRSVTFETYCYWSGEVGEQFAEALAERARAGMAVHVTLDWVGAGRGLSSHRSRAPVARSRGSAGTTTRSRSGACR